MTINPDFMNLIEHRIEGLDITPVVTLRDHFAAQAVERMLSTVACYPYLEQREAFLTAARKCYEFADAMMEARK